MYIEGLLYRRAFKYRRAFIYIEGPSCVNEDPHKHMEQLT